MRERCTVLTGNPCKSLAKPSTWIYNGVKLSGRSFFIVIVGLESPPCLIEMDIMWPLLVRIDVTNGTAQPDPQTVHLNAAQQQQKEVSPPNAAPQPLPAHKKPLRLSLASCYPLHHKRSHRQPLLLTPLTALGCSRKRRYPPKLPAYSAATTRGPKRASISAQETLCRHS